MSRHFWIHQTISKCGTTYIYWWIFTIEEAVYRQDWLKKLSKKQSVSWVNLKNYLENEPNVLYLSDPIHVVGDIHGQFYDLVEHLEKMNIYSLIVNNNQNPLSKRRKVLFLGDYVDRGNFSVEVTILLLILKIYQPKTFFLLRGNH